MWARRDPFESRVVSAQLSRRANLSLGGTHDAMSGGKEKLETLQNCAPKVERVEALLFAEELLPHVTSISKLPDLASRAACRESCRRHRKKIRSLHPRCHTLHPRLDVTLSLTPLLCVTTNFRNFKLILFDTCHTMSRTITVGWRLRWRLPLSCACASRRSGLSESNFGIEWRFVVRLTTTVLSLSLRSRVKQPRLLPPHVPGPQSTCC